MEETDSKFTSESGELSEKEGEINRRSTRRGLVANIFHLLTTMQKLL